MFGNSNLQLPPQIFYGIKVWTLARPLQDLKVLLLEPFLCCLGCVLGHCHTWIPIHDSFSMPWPWRYMVSSIVPLVWCSCPVPLAEKHPQSIMFPPPCLTVGMVFLGSFLLLQTRRVELMPKSCILVLSDHNTFTQFSSESLANFRRACTCAFLSRGTLRVLQDSSPSRRGVLPIVFLVTMVPAALRSLTRSCRVALGWFINVLMITETPRGEILHGAPVRGRLTVILCFFHLRIIAPTVMTFSPSCLMDWLLLRTGVFYTGNKLRLPLRECS